MLGRTHFRTTSGARSVTRRRTHVPLLRIAINYRQRASAGRRSVVAPMPERSGPVLP